MGDAEISLQKQQKQPGRPFCKGQSGNPAGRPLGLKNRATAAIAAAEALLDGEVEGVFRKLLDLALGGDRVALRVCADRILPPRRERPVQFECPPSRDARPCEAPGARSCGIACRLGRGADCRVLARRGLALAPALPRDAPLFFGRGGAAA